MARSYARTKVLLTAGVAASVIAGAVYFDVAATPDGATTTGPTAQSATTTTPGSEASRQPADRVPRRRSRGS